MKSILSVENVEKYYGNKENITKAIDNISFKVFEGEFVGIMGPSGSGKTTLLNCISTIDNVTTGKIIINEKDITRLKEKDLEKFRQNELGFVFQDSYKKKKKRIRSIYDTWNGKKKDIDYTCFRNFTSSHCIFDFWAFIRTFNFTGYIITYNKYV